ncbi:hypothetical protein DFH06DRAFT_994994, partial [Mycena polygramma]
QGGKRGPKSESRRHFHAPVATTSNGDKRWSFQCRHCKTCVTFERKVSKTQLFGDETPAPALGNLATHVRTHHKGVPPPPDVLPGEVRDISASSAKIMADFFVEGKLNPVINSTQGNFLKIFAAWIIEDNLPFTTGETPGIERLFAFTSSLGFCLVNWIQALDIWVLEREELRPLYLKPEDWKLLEALEGVLKMFTLVTKHMSRSSTPTLPWVLPMYEGMLKHLRTCKLDNSLSAKLRVAAEAGLEKLEEYYDKACQCQLNVIATCTCPQTLFCLFFDAFFQYFTPVSESHGSVRTTLSPGSIRRVRLMQRYCSSTSMNHTGKFPPARTRMCPHRRHLGVRGRARSVLSSTTYAWLMSLMLRSPNRR